MTAGTILVTGAGGGIGAETCRKLRATGLEPLVTDLDPDTARTLAEELEARWLRLDVTSMDSWTRLRQRLDEDGIEVDGLILNAGLAGGGDLARFDQDRYRALFAVNVDGVVNGIATFLEVLKERPTATVVVTASLAGVTGTPFDPFYAMTKHALVGLVRSSAATLAAAGVTLQAVCPGIVGTPLLGAAREELDDAGYPLLTATEVAEVLVECTRGLRTDTVTVVQVGRAPMGYRFAGVPGPGVRSNDLPENLALGRTTT